VLDSGLISLLEALMHHASIHGEFLNRVSDQWRSCLLLFRPLDDKHIRFSPEMLSTALGLFNIPDPVCLCATQEPDPERRIAHKGHIRVCSTEGVHYGKVVYGCRSQHNGCGMFSK